MKKSGLKFLKILSLGLIFASHTGFAFTQQVSSAQKLIDKAWSAQSNKNIDLTFKLTDKCIRAYQKQADKEQASLKSLPMGVEEINKVDALNNVAVAYFIEGDTYFKYLGKTKEAVQAFQTIINNYYFGQGWDNHGLYWNVAKAAQGYIDFLDGKVEVPIPAATTPEVTPPKIFLHDPGTEDFVNYEKYGKFENVGTKDYRYVITDPQGLSKAVGEGIYPNGEPSAEKLFETAVKLEQSSLILHAIKCYYAIIVHFPDSYGITYFNTRWYIGQVAISKIQYLLRHNLSLGYKLVDADIKILNAFDMNARQVIAVTNPGRFIKASSQSVDEIVRKPKGIAKQVGGGNVHLVQYDTGDWQLMVDGHPYMIKGVYYSPTKVGESPDDGTLTNWMYDDFNFNGKIDGPYDAYVENKPPVGDFELMKEMGVNTIRWYHQPFDANKKLLRDLYKNYGIRVIVGDFLGKYALGSDARWFPGTDYTNVRQKKHMMRSVLDMVREFKDEPYVLFWLLGNENGYGFACNADKYPEDFFKFANEVAREIKKIDPNHLVAIDVGDEAFLDKFAQYSPDVDIFGTNSYRGREGFGHLWEDVKDMTDKPVFIAEFGEPAYSMGKTFEEAEDLQAEYLQGSWEDIVLNSAFHEGQGNSLGGVAFEWLDEWWKDYNPVQHDTRPTTPGPFPDGYMHEEWLGICGQGDGRASPFLRHLRKAYFMFKDQWHK